MGVSPEQVRLALAKTLDYCAAEEYKGYSLYDSHNGVVPFGSLGPKVSFYANQIVKRSPINLRPMLGIKKDVNPKGMGLFLLALSQLFERGMMLPEISWQHGSLLGEMEFFFHWLEEHPSDGYEGYCWGYNYDWPKRDGTLVPAYTPSSVVTGFNSRAIYAYYRATGSEAAAKVLSGAADFVVGHLPQTESDAGLCFSYTPLQRDLTINANLLAAEVLAYSDAANKENNYGEMVVRVLDFTLARQNPDGSWYYSHAVEDGTGRWQVDFHQGYVLESIYRLCDVLDVEMDHCREALDRGLRFYWNQQFDSAGRAFWRFPRKWPVDIHNQSQGIITFTMLDPLLEGGRNKAERILDYTLRTMWNQRSGNFYYQKWPLLLNRTSYMRWNQAWMVVAMAQFLTSSARSG